MVTLIKVIFKWILKSWIILIYDPFINPRALCRNDLWLLCKCVLVMCLQWLPGLMLFQWEKTLLCVSHDSYLPTGQFYNDKRIERPFIGPQCHCCFCLSPWQTCVKLWILPMLIDFCLRQGLSSQFLFLFMFHCMWMSVLTFSSYLNKTPHTEWFKQWKLIFSLFWKTEIQHQGAGVLICDVISLPSNETPSHHVLILPLLSVYVCRRREVVGHPL